MEPQLAKDVMERTFKLYGWKRMDSRRVANDSLLGRLNREFQSRQPSFTNFAKVQTLALTQCSNAPKVQRLSEGVSLLTGADASATQNSVLDLWKWTNALDVVTNTWAIAGSFEAKQQEIEPSGTATMTTYAHYSDLQEYAYEFTHKIIPLRRLHGDASIFMYLSTVEEKTRAKALEMARGTTRFAFGYALTQALKSESGA